MPERKMGLVPIEMVERAIRVGDEVLAVQKEAFAAGREHGRRETAKQAIALAERFLEDLDRTHVALTPAQIDIFDETYRAAGPDPIIAAYFGSAADMLSRYLRELRQVTADEVNV